MAGEEAHGIDPDAAVIVSAGSKTVVVSTIPTCGVDAAEYLAGLVHATAALLQRPKPDKASHTFTVASKPIHFFDLTGAPYSTVYGGIAIGDRLLTVRAVFPPALMTPGLDLLKRTLEGIELLDDAEISALAALLPQGDQTRVVRAGRSLRAGHYVDFAHGVRADLGDEPMLPTMDAEAEAASSTLVLLRPAAGLRTAVVSDTAATVDLGTEQRALAARLLGVTPNDVAPEPGRGAASSPIWFSYSLIAGPKGRVEISTSENANCRVHVATWGLKSCVERGTAGTAKLVGKIKLESSAIAEEAITPTRVTNARFGFGFDLSLPGGPWQKTAMALPPAMAPIAVGYEFRAKGDTIGVMAIHIDEAGQDPDFLLGFLEQIFAAKLGNKREKVERSDRRLGGLMGRHLRWSDNFSATMAHAGGTHYILFVEQGTLSSLDSEKLLSTFAISP